MSKTALDDIGEKTNCLHSQALIKRLGDQAEAHCPKIFAGKLGGPKLGPQAQLSPLISW